MFCCALIAESRSLDCSNTNSTAIEAKSSVACDTEDCPLDDDDAGVVAVDDGADDAAVEVAAATDLVVLCWKTMPAEVPTVLVRSRSKGTRSAIAVGVGEERPVAIGRSFSL